MANFLFQPDPIDGGNSNQ